MNDFDVLLENINYIKQKTNAKKIVIYEIYNNKLLRKAETNDNFIK